VVPGTRRKTSSVRESHRVHDFFKTIYGRPIVAPPPSPRLVYGSRGKTKRRTDDSEERVGARGRVRVFRNEHVAARSRDGRGRGLFDGRPILCKVRPPKRPPTNGTPHLNRSRRGAKIRRKKLDDIVLMYFVRTHTWSREHVGRRVLYENRTAYTISLKPYTADRSSLRRRPPDSCTVHAGKRNADLTIPKNVSARAVGFEFSGTWRDRETVADAVRPKRPPTNGTPHLNRSRRGAKIETRRRRFNVSNARARCRRGPSGPRVMNDDGHIVSPGLPGAVENTPRQRAHYNGVP